MSVANALRDRINPSWPERHRTAIDETLAAIEGLARRRAALDANADLSGPGRAKQLRAHASETTARQYATAARTLAALREESAAARAALLTKAASVEFGSEIRSVLRAMSLRERVDLLVDPAVDKRVMAAFLTAPAFLSGAVPDDLRARVEQTYLARHHGDDLAKIAANENAAALLEVAIGTLLGPLQDAADVPPHQFENWLQDTVKLSPDEQRQERFREACAAIIARDLPDRESNALMNAAHIEIFGAAAA